MKVLITGASGLIGKKLTVTLRERGEEVYSLSRTKKTSASFCWSPSKKEIEPLPRFDCVIHLAGEGIAALRWTKSKKDKIYASRVEGTRLLCKELANNPPTTLISASASGFYGSHANKVFTEEDPAGDTFLAKVCVDWEGAANKLLKHGTRVVNTRFGVVLSKDGGMLAQILPAFKFCLGGRIGSGEQYLSWISIKDAVAAITYCIYNNSISGPVNLVSPTPVTNAEFTKILSSAVRRPAILPLPASIARLLLGEMANELLLASTRVAPVVLSNAGFVFSEPNLKHALSVAASQAPA